MEIFTRKKIPEVGASFSLFIFSLFVNLIPAGLCGSLSHTEVIQLTKNAGIMENINHAILKSIYNSKSENHKAVSGETSSGLLSETILSIPMVTAKANANTIPENKYISNPSFSQLPRFTTFHATICPKRYIPNTHSDTMQSKPKVPCNDIMIKVTAVAKTDRASYFQNLLSVNFIGSRFYIVPKNIYTLLFLLFTI